MEPVYKGLKDLINFYTNYGYSYQLLIHDREANPLDEEGAAREALGIIHNHGCWLNPTGTLMSHRTKRLCKKFCKKHNIPKEPYYKKNYDCDMCPNCITYYKNGDDFLFALGNSYLYEKQGKIK